MAKRLQPVIVGLVLLCGGASRSVPCQAIQAQQPMPAGQAQRRAPIEHYYWHFLLHQNELDVWAAAQAAKGLDGSALRNHLQKNMGFSDADYAPVRASSARLTAKIRSLNAQAVAIRAAGPTSTSYAQLQALTGQREADINAEVAFIRSNLSPDKTARLEAFMVQFFSHVASQPVPGSQQAAPAAVQP